MDAKERIDFLRKELNKHNDLYYLHAAPEITDYEFDQMMKELQNLEKDNPQYYDISSPTLRVGSDINKAFTQVKHRYPMLSLGNTYTKEEIVDFVNRCEASLNEPVKICAELKYDGTSISLTYEEGKLTTAVTRGDGEKGDDVTDNVRTIRTVPLQLKGDYPSDFEMRGEVLLPWKEFDRLNEERTHKEEPLFANPRNAASGTLKLQNSKIVASRKLEAILYYMLGSKLPSDSHYENLEIASTWGFNTGEYTRLCNNIDEILDFIAYWDVERKNLPVATDGIVLKVDSIRQQEELGYTAKSPRWAIAFKFKAERAESILREVTFQVGRTGIVTPVANLDPVQLSGTVVKRASLYNEDAINALDLHIGDTCYVEKGGEIIPKIVGVDTQNRKNVGPKVTFIKNCPECGTPLERIPGEAAYFCPNQNGCAPQIKGRFEHFISRKAMNLDGIGPETIDAFFANGLISNFADLYSLSLDQIMQCPRSKSSESEEVEVDKTGGENSLSFEDPKSVVQRNLESSDEVLQDSIFAEVEEISSKADDSRSAEDDAIFGGLFAQPTPTKKRKSSTPRRFTKLQAEKIIKALNKSKEVPFERVLFALGLRYVGETVAKRLSHAFKNIDSLSQATYEDLITVEDVGERIAESVIEYFSDTANKALIERLKEKGLQFSLSEEHLSERTEKLKGLNIVISGTFAKHSRDEYKSMIELNGGKNTGSISAKTNYILAGENMGPAKIEKAQKLNIPIIDEEVFLKMLE